ncbi:MAG: pilus assembly protein PilP, partial [Mariprofundaceae bacterium]|nr:pilus assembly protein PilP [Mariprofundaceae bacterium]
VQSIKAPDIDIAGLRDPFESYLTVLEQQNQKRIQAHRSKASDRAAQPLENFDLGALRLVAIMKMGDAHAAMVEDPEGKGYVVRTGTYIGRDNGRVVKISARRVEIMEDEFTATGAIAKRKASLTLNEVNNP